MLQCIIIIYIYKVGDWYYEYIYIFKTVIIGIMSLKKCVYLCSFFGISLRF